MRVSRRLREVVEKKLRKRKVVVVGKAWSAWSTTDGAEQRERVLLQVGASRAQAEILKQRSWTALSRWAKMKIKNAMKKEVTQ